MKTQYGYHIIQVLAHEDAHQRTLLEAKADLTTQWKKQRVNDRMGSISEQTQAELQKDVANAGQVAEKLGMKSYTILDYEPSQSLPDLGSNAEVGQAIMALKAGEVTPPVGVDNKVAFAVVTAVVPSRPAIFAEVKTPIHDALVQTRSANVLQKHAQDLADNARKAGELMKSAKGAGLDAKTSVEVSRSGSIDGLGSASYLEDAFNRPDGSVLGPIGMPDGTAIIRVTAHIPADPAKLAEQRDSIADTVRRQKQSDRSAIFEEGIRDALIKSGKIKIHQPVVQRLIARYTTTS